MIRKLLVSEGGRERDVLVIGTVIVGRDPDCDISGTQPLLSRRHAEIVTIGATVTVRDLQSRNGITVNGSKVPDAVLKPGDVIDVAGIRIEYLEERQPEPAAAALTDDEATRLLRQSDWEMKVAAVKSALPVSAPPESEDDKTRLLAQYAVHSAMARAGSGAGKTPAVKAPVPMARPVRRPTEPAVPRVVRTEGHWSSRIRLYCVAISAGVFIVTFASLFLWHQRQISANQLLRASSLGAWLAAEASTLDVRKPAPDFGRELMMEPGITEVAVLTLDGRVIAPTRVAGEAIDTIADIGVKPAELFLPKAVETPTGVVVARPVTAPNGQRIAVARLKYRAPADAAQSGLLVFIAPAALFALFAALGGAVYIQRFTMVTLSAFNDSIERALNSGHDAVYDPLGSRVTRDLSDSINYMMTRIRNAPAAAAAMPRAAVPEGDSIRQAMSAQARMSLRVDARMHVTAADPNWLAAFGFTEQQIIGAHLLDALPTPALADAVVRGLGGWNGQSCQSFSVNLGDGQPPIGFEIERDEAESTRITFIPAGTRPFMQAAES